MLRFILVACAVCAVHSAGLLIPTVPSQNPTFFTQSTPLKGNGTAYGQPRNGMSREICASEGTFVAMSINDCTGDECNIITKRENAVTLTFIPRVTSSTLSWKVSAYLSGVLETLDERNIEGTFTGGATSFVDSQFSFSIAAEGLKLQTVIQVIDRETGRIEVCAQVFLDISAWHMVPEIISRISAPIFPNRDFLITNYGAVAGGEIDNTAAIASAIQDCNAAGGGRVVVPPGIFLSSAITLLSNVNLHLSEGATILFTHDYSSYKNVLSRWEGMDLMNYSPLIYAYEAENIAITGSGTLDGNADCEHWWPWKGTNGNLQKLCGDIPEEYPRQDDDRDSLTEMVLNGVPVEERVFGVGHYLRPNFVQPYLSKNILIEGITLLRSPMWILNPVLCENLIVRGVTINSTGPNSDGCDPESCKDVLIENVKFRTGDDCIAVKSGRNNDGRKWNVKSENIVVQNCEMEDGHGAFTIGSEISGGAQNIFCQNCQMNSPNLEQALRFKNNAVRGALIEDVYIRNIHMRELYTGTSPSRGMALSIDFNYEEGPAGDYHPVVRNVDIRNVTASKANYALYLRGFPQDPISNVRLYDCHFENVDRGNVIENVDDLGLYDVTVNGDQIGTITTAHPVVTPAPSSAGITGMSLLCLLTTIFSVFL